ncbi:uncharacterized protein LOC128093817 [Culex pipiens pallens]|uniref:uncharacterized protein LOC128093817 n=1 Tax=Culex pipiens pallens TaxID=42434 RepID=UPI0022AA873D|nr:uncharacterized protein LOC128093817 [Culex pipiens pallens]
MSIIVGNGQKCHTPISQKMHEDSFHADSDILSCCHASKSCDRRLGVANRLCAPVSPRIKTYTELTALFKDHLGPTTNVVSERYQLRFCEQTPSQRIADFIVTLKAKAQTCEYGDFLQDALRDQFVAGIHDQSLRKKLLTESTLTFEKACTIAKAYEAALSQNKDMSAPSASKMAALHNGGPSRQSKGKQPSRNQSSKSSRPPPMPKKPCFRCGRDHDPDKCPALDWTCYACGKKGHVSSVCQSKSRQSQPKGSSKRVGEMSEAVEVLRLNVLAGVGETAVRAARQQSSAAQSAAGSGSVSVLEPSSSKTPSSSNGGSPGSLNRVDSPELVSLDCEGRRLEFEADCGACKSVISAATYQKYFSHYPLVPTAQEFISVSGQRIQPQGLVSLRVSAPSGIQGKLDLIVITTAKKMYPLLGRDGLDLMYPEWRKVFSVKSVSSAQTSFESELLKRFPKVVSETAKDVITGFSAEIVLKPDGSCLCWPTTVAFMLHRRGGKRICCACG